MANSHGWRTRWILAAAAVAVAAGVLAWVIGTTPTRAPTHFWVRNDDPGLRPYTAPNGDVIRGWTAQEPPWVSGAGARGNSNRRTTGPWILDVARAESSIRRTFRAIGLSVPDPAPTLARRMNAPNSDPAGWTEFIDAPGRLPADAVPDAALTGVWQAAADDVLDGLDAGDRCTLWPTGELAYGDDPANRGCGRWGRIGDVVYLHWRPTPAPGEPARATIGTRCDSLVLAPDLRSMRGATRMAVVADVAAVRVR